MLLLIGIVSSTIVVTLSWFFRPRYSHLEHETLPPVTREEALAELKTDASLRPLLLSHRVSFSTLVERGWGPVLEIVRVLIGVIPAFAQYAAIYDPAWRIYNYMVPNFFNVPVHTLGLGNATPASLAMYVASRVAECTYCSAHSCSFALRRGAPVETLVGALMPDAYKHLDQKDLAVVEMARSLVRNEYGDKARKSFGEAFPNASEAEWVACGAIGMGFLNKITNALGVPLEESVHEETAEVIGSSGFLLGKAGQDINKKNGTSGSPSSSIPKEDNFFTKIEHLRYLPGAIGLEMSLTKGVPSRWPAVGNFLEELSGCRFPILEQLVNKCVRFAVTAMLRDSLIAAESSVGLAIKPAMGVIYSGVVKCTTVDIYMREMSRKLGTSKAQLNEAALLVNDDTASASPLLQLAKAVSFSPAQVTPELQQMLLTAQVSPESIVETVAWVAVLQLLQRLIAFYSDPLDKTIPQQVTPAMKI